MMTNGEQHDQGNEEERLTQLVEAQQRARAEAEDALEYVQDIIGTLREPFLIMDESLHVLDANESFYERFQVTREETIGRMICDLGNGQWDIPQLREALHLIMTQSQRLTDFEVTHAFPTIGRRVMLLNARRVRRDHLPQPRDRILLAIEDVTERRRAEERMAASERRYRRLFESARDGILIIDFNGEIVEANPFMETLLGYSREELVGRDLWQSDLFADNTAAQQMFQELQREGYIRHEHLPLVAREGQVVEVEIIGNVYIEGSERVIQYNIRDITQRKQVEAELRRNEERLRKIVASTAVGVLFFDEVTGRLLDANDTFLGITGYSRSEVEAGELDWRKMTPPEHVEESLRQMERLALTGHIGPYEKEYFCQDGSRKWMLFSGASLGDSTVVEFCIDVTDRKQAEEALLEADRRKDEFLAMLSHELRNPLAPITNAVRLLQLGLDDNEFQQEALSVLDRQVRTLTRLVEDLLDVSRVTTGRIHLQTEDLDLNNLVQSVADSFHPEMVERRHEFSVSLTGAPLWVHGDATRLEQVVVNLLSNAAKYTPDGGQVWLMIEEEEGGEALIRVRDSGMGIDPTLLVHVFELFSQGVRELGRTKSGLGIGLALVKSLVEMHGGTVTAQSEGSDRGSEFVVRLPAVPSPAPQAVTPPEGSAEPATRSLRVLLVDDVADTRIIFGRLLEILGYQVSTAGDGTSALEAALEFEPDVVLLDLGLPGMNGYEVAQRMRQQPVLQNVVLAALTGYGQQSDRQRSQQMGFDHHLVKPIDVDELQQLLAAIAESRIR
jgi:PAS domain S-box-containing protein